MQTKSGTTVVGIQALYEEIDNMQQKAPDADELKRAKDQILNSFIFRFDTPGKVLREKMAYEFYHYPLDFLERYRSEIDKVTAEQVTRSRASTCRKTSWQYWWWATTPSSTSRSAAWGR